eukprot:8133556-Prorocentrum_lima.AAC.1
MSARSAMIDMYCGKVTVYRNLPFSHATDNGTNSGNIYDCGATRCGFPLTFGRYSLGGSVNVQ